MGGAVRHREQWGSSYELALMDTSRRGRPQVAALLGAQLDSVLSSVRVERLDAPGASFGCGAAASLFPTARDATVSVTHGVWRRVFL